MVQGESCDPEEQAIHLREGQWQGPDLHLPRVRLRRQRRVRRVHRQRGQRRRLRRQLQGPWPWPVSFFSLNISRVQS